MDNASTDEMLDEGKRLAEELLAAWPFERGTLDDAPDVLRAYVPKEWSAALIYARLLGLVDVVADRIVRVEVAQQAWKLSKPLAVEFSTAAPTELARQGVDMAACRAFAPDAGSQLVVRATITCRFEGATLFGQLMYALLDLGMALRDGTATLSVPELN